MNCNLDNNRYQYSWKFNYSKEDHQKYLKSDGIIHLSTWLYDKQMFLCSNEIQSTTGDNVFQEVACHDEKLGRNDEVSNLILPLFNLNILLNSFFFF